MFETTRDNEPEFATVLRRWCLDRFNGMTDVGPFSAAMWHEVGQLGLLGLGTPEGGGAVSDIVIAMETFGHVGYCGPLVPTFVAGQLLDERDRRGIDEGRDLAAVDFGQRTIAWAGAASIYVEIDLESWQAWRCEPTSPPCSRPTMSGEPWASISLQRQACLGDARHAVAVGLVAQAAYLVAAGLRMIGEAARYAHERVQFGSSIGTFQAVSHPLADSWARLDAARAMVRDVASDDVPDSTRAARAQLAAARHAVDAAYRAYQTFGGMGFATENHVATMGLRIREVSLVGPPKEVVQREALGGSGL